MKFKLMRILFSLIIMTGALLTQGSARSDDNIDFFDRMIPGNQITLLKNGDDLHSERMKMIRGADHSIYISMFAIHADKIGKEIFQGLCDKARAGLDVRAIIDHRASKDFFTYSMKLKDCGAHVISFRPGSRFFALHEKLLIVDGQKYITGGSGYSLTYKHHSFDSYLLERREANKVKKGWYDFDVMVSGTSACSFHQQYQRNFKHLALMVADYNPDIWWYGWKNFSSMKEKYYGLKKFKNCTLPKGKKWYGQSRVRPILANPYYSKTRPILDAHIEAIRLAETSSTRKITMYAPYFVPAPKMVEALVRAQKNGVQVTIITNSIRATDEQKAGKTLFIAMMESIKPMLKAGVELRLWDNLSMLHRKGGVYGDVAVVGSDNLDNRAQDFQSESVIFSDDLNLVNEIRDDFARDVEKTMLVTKEYIDNVYRTTPWIYKFIAKHFKKYF